MKRFMKAAWILAASALAFSSCVEEQALAPQDEQAGKITVNITAGSADTKTHLDGTNKVKWDGGETIELLEQGTKFVHATSDAGTASSDGLTAKFTAGLTGGATGPFDYYAVYPSDSYPSSSNANVAEIKLVHPNLQNPTATSFDPKADLLVSQGVHMDARATDLDFNFARPIAIMEMTVKGLTDGEKINSVEFSSESAILSGRMKYDFSTGKVVSYGYTNNELKSITCNYTDSDYQTASAGNKIYFTVFPTGKNPALADFTVAVTTDKATYTKKVTPPTALTIHPNDLVKFNVAGLTRTASATDKYDLLTDASQLEEGDKILIVADPTQGTVAMAGENEKGDIRLTVPVTINTDNTITTLPDGIQIIELLNSTITGEFMLRTSDNPVLELEHHGNNTLYSQYPGSSWKIGINADGITTISTENDARFIQYNYNNSNDRFAAYKGTQTDVKIFYKKGTPKTALATPTFTTELVDNAILVYLNEVTNAVSYTVSCTGEKDIVVDAVNIKDGAIFENLAWNASYTISVVANPAEGSEKLKSSKAATTTVEIGANPEQANASIKDLRAEIIANNNYDLTTYCGGSVTAIFTARSGANCSFVDNTGEPGSGIILRNPSGDENLVPGQKYNIALTSSAKINIYKNLVQIEKATVTATSDKTVALVIPTITATELNSDEYQGMYVQMNATTPATAGTWAINPTLTDATGAEINVHLDKNATFKDVAFKANTTATIKGIASCFTNPQLELTSEDDIVAFIDTTPEFSLADAAKEIASTGASAVTLTTVTVNKFIQETSFSVSSDQTWLTNLKVAGGKVVADVTENTSTTLDREATVTVTYDGAKVATQTITVKQAAKGQSTTKYFTKVTAAPTDWSGEYLLVASNSSTYYAFNGTFGSWGKASIVTVANNKIESKTATDQYKVIIEKVPTSGTYTIKFNTGAYISSSAVKKFNSKTTCTATSEQFNISLNNDKTVKIESSKTPGRLVRYNHNSGSGGFRFYDGTTGVAPILFKLD